MTNDNDNRADIREKSVLPRHAYLPINRCNLPAVILGSTAFQRHPVPLQIDGIATLYRDLFQRLDDLDEATQRAHCFIDYMTVRFRLHSPQDAGFDSSMRLDRSKANYQRLVRGWMFDPDSREGAVLKGWVESRFGLLPRYHKGIIKEAESDNYYQYLHERQLGLYNTNALETQLDLLYSYCQYELARQQPERTHWRLFRGFNPHEEYRHSDPRKQMDDKTVIILNNMSSFSTTLHHADSFGDLLVEAQVPLAKIFCYSQLLPGMLSGEDEAIVIGGAYEITVFAQ